LKSGRADAIIFEFWCGKLKIHIKRSVILGKKEILGLVEKGRDHQTFITEKV